ncbi:MAG TPA: recombinase family protein [Gemmatirosa sp.]
MLIGYARVSTAEQSLALQQDALAHAGCERTYTDVISGATDAREGLDAAFDYLRAGDVLVVWRLDRLGRSLQQLIDRVTTLDARQVGFRSLTEAMDTTTCGGRLVFHMFGALAEFERGIIRERSKAGLAAARARGRVGGRRRQVTDAEAAEMRALLAAPHASVRAVCERFGRSRSTVYRYAPAPTWGPAPELPTPTAHDPGA